MISFSAILILLGNLYEIDFSEGLGMFVLLFPALSFLFPILIVYLTGVLVQKRAVFQDPVLIRLNSSHFMGIIFLLLGVVLVLQRFDKHMVLNIVSIVFVFDFFWRLIRSVSAISRQRFEWFYIILYLCSLEILPMALFYVWFLGYFD